MCESLPTPLPAVGMIVDKTRIPTQKSETMEAHMERWLDRTWRHMETAFDTLGESVDSAFHPQRAGKFEHSKAFGSAYEFLSDDASSIVVAFDLPGVKKDDIEVELVENHVLLLSGKRSGRGSFKWRVRLADAINPNGVTATLADGVLTVTVEKLLNPAKATRKIPVG